jgi:IclR family pca regulon transcriptional regulator
MTLSQVAEVTGLSRPTARRILLTLEAEGYASSDGKTFALTPRVLALGYAYLSSLNLTEIAQPYMERVVEQTDEGCSLATFDQTEVVYVTRVPTHRISSITLATGTRLPAHATSMGHVLLAGLSEPELQRYLAHADLLPLTGNTITRREDLTFRLDLVREQGYAIVDQELEHGLRSVAAPVKDSNGRVIAALALSAMTATTDEQIFRAHHAAIIVGAAREISRDLGADFSEQGSGP